jgi:ankyrin repeat protein
MGLYNRTPLGWASNAGHVGVVRVLLDKWADIDVDDDEGYTPLNIACYHGRPPVVRLLLEKGADPTLARHEDWTPLMSAVRESLEIVRLLLGHTIAKTTVNDRSHSGKTALWEACELGKEGGREGAAGERSGPHDHRHRRHQPHGHRQAALPY